MAEADTEGAEQGAGEDIGGKMEAVVDAGVADGEGEEVCGECEGGKTGEGRSGEDEGSGGVPGGKAVLVGDGEQAFAVKISVAGAGPAGESLDEFVGGQFEQKSESHGEEERQGVGDSEEDRQEGEEEIGRSIGQAAHGAVPVAAPGGGAGWRKREEENAVPGTATIDKSCPAHDSIKPYER